MFLCVTHLCVSVVIAKVYSVVKYKLYDERKQTENSAKYRTARYPWVKFCAFVSVADDYNSF